MSSITLPTRYLVGLIEDAVLTTADPKMELPHLTAVLLHSAEGYWDVPADKNGDDQDAEPLFDEVRAELLVATSTSLAMIGQGHTMCSTGRLHKPVLVSKMDAEALIKVFKPLITGRLPKNVFHETVLTLTGGTLIVAEDPNLVPGGKSLTFEAMDFNDFPRNIADLLDVNPDTPVVVDGHPVAAAYGTGWNGELVSVIGKIAKRRVMPVAVYRHHHRGRVVVTIGRSYRAVVMPSPLGEEELQEPLVVVFDPPLPARKEKPKTEPLVSV